MQNGMVSGTFNYGGRVENYTYEPSLWKKWTTEDCLIIKRIGLIALYVLATVVTSFVFLLVDERRRFKGMEAGQLAAKAAVDNRNESKQKDFFTGLEKKIHDSDQHLGVAEGFLRECQKGDEIPQIALRFIIPLEIEKRREIMQVLETIETSYGTAGKEKIPNLMNQVSRLKKDLAIIRNKVKEITRFWRKNNKSTVDDLSEAGLLDESLIQVVKKIHENDYRDKLNAWLTTIPGCIDDFKKHDNMLNPVIRIDEDDLQTKEFFEFYKDYTAKQYEVMNLLELRIQSSEKSSIKDLKRYCEEFKFHLVELSYVYELMAEINSADKTKEEVLGLIDDHYGDAEARVDNSNVEEDLQQILEDLKTQ